jgi:endonuclease/exonuclease/phosphatase family metal-dependent hydrolase
VRIVSWNTHQGFTRKREALRALAPDLAVLCEVDAANPWEGSLLDGPVCWQAHGPWPNKQVAVSGFGEHFHPRTGLETAGRFCAGLAGPGIGLLGVWSVPESPARYGQEVLRILEANAEWISGGDVVVAGDFNINARGVGNGPLGPALFTRITDRMAEYRLVSAYHTYTNEAFGEESMMTHFHRYNPEAGFHIDYCFIPAAWSKRLVRVDVGAPADWLGLSDHMPLIIDLADTPQSPGLVGYPG